MSVSYEQALRSLWELLERSRSWEEQIDADPDAPRVQPGSALTEDDALTKPFHLSHSAWHALVVAVDHLRCLRWALDGEVRENQVRFRIGTHSPRTVLRGAIENGARAVWLLMPDSRSTRIAHRLSLETYEFAQANKLRELLNGDQDDTDIHGQQLQELVQAAQLPKADAKSALGFPGYGVLVKEAGGKIAVVAWRGCSSLAHGDIRPGCVSRRAVELVGRHSSGEGRRGRSRGVGSAGTTG